MMDAIYESLNPENIYSPMSIYYNSYLAAIVFVVVLTILNGSRK